MSDFTQLPLEAQKAFCIVLALKLTVHYVKEDAQKIWYMWTPFWGSIICMHYEMCIPIKNIVYYIGTGVFFFFAAAAAVAASVKTLMLGLRNGAKHHCIVQGQAFWP